MRNNKMMKKWSYVFIFIFMSLSLWVVVAKEHNFSLKPIDHKPKKVSENKTTNDIKLSRVEEEQLWVEYEEAIKKIDPARESYWLKGKLFIYQEKDKQSIVPETDYEVKKNQAYFYMKVGETETYQEKDLSVVASHELKKIMISAKSFSNNSLGTISLKKLKNELLSEGYRLSANIKDGIKTIILKNEEHLRFKEYRLSFDLRNKKVVGIYSRLANEHDPFIKGEGKIIEVKLSLCEDIVNTIPHYKEVISLEKESIEKKKAYKDYEVLIL